MQSNLPLETISTPKKMRWLMLCREPRLYSCQRLLEAAMARGVEMDILDPNRCLLQLENGAFQLCYQDGEPFCKNRPKPYRLPEYTGVLPRFGITSNEMGLNVLRHLERKNVVSLNHSDAFRLARDKWQSLQALVAHNIPVPNSALTGTLFSLKESVAQIGSPTVVKTLTGAQGVGVMLSEHSAQTVSLLETLRQANVPTLTQQFIAEAQGEDIRAFVIGDQVVAAMQRRGGKGEFRANIHQGGSAEAVALSSDEQQLAVNAAKAIGLTVAGVDLIRAKQGLMVLEVNASPGLEMIEKVSNVDIAGLMVERLLQDKMLLATEC